jgi:diguanylate cyclase (GGDEF)-like protein
VDLIRRHGGPAAAAVAVILIGVVAFWVWSDSRQAARDEVVLSQTQALRDGVGSTMAQVLAQTNYLRGAVETNPRPDALDRAFRTGSMPALSGAATIDVSRPERPTVTRRVGALSALDDTLAAAPLPDPGDGTLLLDGELSKGLIKFVTISRKDDVVVLHEAAIEQAPLALLAAVQHPSIDYDVSLTLADGRELAVLRKPESGLGTGADATVLSFTTLGIDAELRTRASAGLPPVVGTSMIAVWALCILAAALGAAWLVRWAATRRHELRERSKRERELLFKSMHDELTGLPNRAALFHHLENEVDETVGLLFIDLDGFKSVNDRHGHLVGDEVLKMIGSRLRGGVRSDDLVYRLAGDEFVIVCRAEDDLETLRRRLQEMIELPVEVGDDYVFISASVGCTAAEAGGPDGARGALQAADEAMYEDKRLRQAAEKRARHDADDRPTPAS